MRAAHARVLRQALLSAMLLACAAVAAAQTPEATATPAAAPAFDRPGIGFGTATLAPGTFAWEQGVPDFQRTSDSGADSTLYSATTLLRAGLTRTLELQLGSAIANRLQERAAGHTTTVHGRGDMTLALKMTLPSPSAQLSWAALGAVNFADGSRAFAATRTGYDLGVTLSYELSDAWSGGFYINASRADGTSTVDVSPSLNFAIAKSLGAFVEVGANYGSHGLNDAVLGGGFTLMVTRAVQLDLSADVGLTSNSPKLQGGFGVCVYFQ